MRKIGVVSLLAILVLAVSACAALAPAPEPTATPEPTPTPEPPADIVDTAVAAGSFETLVTAVQAVELEGALRGEGPFTVFAPTDEAFNALPEGTLEELLADPTGQLQQILLYHVVPGKVMAADVSDGLEAETLQGSTVSFSVMDGEVKINDATIVSTDIEASNGVIHVIDAVILPPAEEEAAEELDIVDTAIAAGSFETLVTAVQAAELEGALRGEGPFTVFAPTDAAFNALPDGTLEELLADPTGDLQQILLYHVVPGRVMAADVSDGLEAETLQGSTVSFAEGANGELHINEAVIVSTDIEASNGVIHVIDAVILPPEL